MAQNSDNYHEPYEILSPETRDLHRAVVSLIEELEAIDWYQQRAEACADSELTEVLLHNQREEMEHAMMSLEWLRRHLPPLDEVARVYLFTDGPLTEIEDAPAAGPGDGDASLGLGSLREVS